MHLRATLSVLIMATACGGSSEGPPDARRNFPDATVIDAMPTVDAGPPTEFGGTRPVTLDVPTSYSPDTPMPLVIALHGFSMNPDYLPALLGITTWYEDNGFLFIAPHGTPDADGNFYWNATPACCDFYDTAPDDVAYLTGLIADISAAYNVDPKRTYVIAHSNGAFMANRLACDHADKIAAIISYAGANYVDPTDCAPSQAVSVLQLHGTADMTIAYDGGILTQKDGTDVAYPSAAATVANWAGYNSCDTGTTRGTPLDVTTTAGDETTVDQHTGCPTGISAELWTMPNLGHVVLFAPGAKDLFWDWFKAHPKP